MQKKIFWKDIRKSFGSSKGRFLSIMLLMTLGAFALTGLKVTTPDMEKTADQYLKDHNTMDLSVIATSGFGSNDKKELDHIDGTQIEYGNMDDVTIKDTDDAVRLFSSSKAISTYKLTSGNLPSQSNEIALSPTLKKKYKIGDNITFTQGDHGILKRTTYKITGFVKSSEIWSSTDMGTSTAGDGTLSAYAVVKQSAFNHNTATIARLRYNNLKHLNPYSKRYSQVLAKNQKKLDNLLSDNDEHRLKVIKSDLQAILKKGQKQITLAKEQLLQQSSLLPYLSGEQLTAAKQTVAQAHKKIANKEAELTQLKTKINNLEAPTYKTYTRSTLPGGEGYYTYDSIRGNIDKIGNLFPVVLYLVAALVTFTTMTRFVNEERNNSGILKALGYSNSDVIKKFVIYGLTSSLLGTIIGTVAGHFILPRVVTRLIATTMTVGAPHLYFYWFYVVFSLLLALISAVFPAFWVAKKELSEKPAQLLLPKPPVKGSKILLERLGFIWKKLSFTQKVTARNIFRYKQRMLMTIFGVTGSVALLFAGLGIQSSLGGVVDKQFNKITAYDMLVIKKKNTDNKEDHKINSFLNSKKVSHYQNLHYKGVDERIHGQIEKKTISIMTSDNNNFKPFIYLRSINSGKNVSLLNNGAVISEKLAEYYKVKKGERFTFKDDGKSYKIKVSDIVEMNVGHYIFMNNNYYQKVFGSKASHNAVLVNLKKRNTKNISKQATHLLAMKGVSSLAQNSSAIRTLNTAVEALNASMTILVVVSILLGIVILYNLTNINVAERIRELSTIKVLGFHNKEVTLYIYRETITLSLLGIVFGLIGGYYLHNAIITIMSRDEMYPKDVTWLIYVIPVITTVTVLTLLGWLVNHRLKVVDMLEALKSVD